MDFKEYIKYKKGNPELASDFSFSKKASVVDNTMNDVDKTIFLSRIFNQVCKLQRQRPELGIEDKKTQRVLLRTFIP